MIENSLVSSSSVWGILIRLGIDLAFLTILIGLVYYRYSKKERFLFTFFLIGIIVFLVASIMKKIDIGFGLAFGLFAIFGILRLRTRNFSVKDMAYLFAAIGLSLFNALGLLIFPFYAVVILNIVIIIASLLLELFIGIKIHKKHSIIYNNLDLLRPENRESLLQDLSAKTGRNILKARVREINFKNGVAKLDIFYKDNGGKVQKEPPKPSEPVETVQQ
jgi:hypothetical protein